MNIASFLNSEVRIPLQSMMRRWATERSSAARISNLRGEFAGTPQKSVVANAFVPVAAVQKRSVRKPLRVVRVVETEQGRACVGRMVISGRMADVCAELDRLAARESARS